MATAAVAAELGEDRHNVVGEVDRQVGVAGFGLESQLGGLVAIGDGELLAIVAAHDAVFGRDGDLGEGRVFFAAVGGAGGDPAVAASSAAELSDCCPD